MTWGRPLADALRQRAGLTASIAMSRILLLALGLVAASAHAQTGTHRGTLGPGDRQLDGGEYYDVFEVAASPGDLIDVDLSSTDFDPYLVLVAPSGEQEENDDYEGSTARSRIQIAATGPGTYRVLVTSYTGGETGAYTVSLQVSGGAPAVAPQPANAPGTGEAGRGGDLVLGEYACYGTGGRLMAGLGFHLHADGRYVDLDGARAGRYTYDRAGSAVAFRGGLLDGQTGRNVGPSGFDLSSTVHCEPW